jgi:hypothetical protein
MKNQRMKCLAAGVLASGLMAFSFMAHSQTVDSVMQQSVDNTAELRAAQERINGIAEQTNNMVQQYKVVTKQIEGLKVYNAQQELQIADQERTLANLDQSIANAATMERDIAPLMVGMIDALGQFVDLDMPFHTEERHERVFKLRNNLGRSNLSTAEKFRQVLEAYSIELEYGNAIEAYTKTVSVDGVEQDVNILRIGRVALMYQTKDLSQSAVWQNGGWQALDDDWNADIAEGLKIARKQSPINIMSIPVSAPQEATR